MRISDMVTLGLRRAGHEAREALFIHAGPDFTRPHAIQIIPTERCNYQCLSCDCWRRDQYPPELSFEEWARALDDLRRFAGPCVLQFGGGEPLVFKPFLNLVEHCANADIGWGMTSNGSGFSPSVAARIAAARPLNVDISVDGATAAVHDRSRGIEGSLERITQGIRHLRAARAQAGGSFPIRIKATVHRLNFHEMPALVDWAVQQGADSIDFSPVRHWTPEVISLLWMQPEDEAALMAVAQALVAAKKAGAPIETEVARLLSWPAHFRGEVALPSVAPCRVGMRDFFIMPNGDARTCWFYPPIGNVKTQSVQEIWQGALAREQRRTMLTCDKFGSPLCASSCLSHRTLAQDGRRAILLAKSRIQNRGRTVAPPGAGTGSP